MGNEPTLASSRRPAFDWQIRDIDTRRTSAAAFVTFDCNSVRPDRRDGDGGFENCMVAISTSDGSLIGYVACRDHGHYSRRLAS